MPTGSNLILPDDPEFHQPVTWGDAYTKTPQGQKEEWIKNSQEQQENGDVKYASSVFAFAPDPWVKQAQLAGTGITNMMTNPMWFSPLHTPQNWQIASRRREIYQWCRFFYDNEPKVAAAIDFYSRFPMSGFKLECKSKKVLSFFKHHVLRKLDLNELFKQISSEHFLLGDVFPFKEVDCPVCGGAGVDPNNPEELCKHPGGTFKRVIVLNPDWIEVQRSVLAEEPSVVLVPDEELKRIVFYKQPREIYDRIPDTVKNLVLQNKPIPLSNRSVSHIKHMPVPYGTYGTSLVRRLFTTLAYKTKIMTANWIVAERLILPVRVVKIGSDQRPATSVDIADIQQQLAATANDPNLTIVTHNNFEYDWYGAAGKILQITQEMEHIDKEILDGMMLNQALLNGEMSGYTSAQVGVETLIRRIESWRHSLAEWCEKEIFEPVCQMQGFIDEEETAEVGETVYMVPKIKWNDLNLKDKTQYWQILNQLHDKQLISGQTLLEEMDLDYDQEVKRQRYEQAQMGPAGAFLPGAGGGSAMGGPGGMPPGMPGAPGGPGGAPGGAPGGGGGAMASAEGKVMKRGKGKQEDEEMAPQFVPIKLTSIEQKMVGMLLNAIQGANMDPAHLRAQFPVENPKGGKPYALDFAIPALKLGIEADGEAWHGTQEQIQDDQQRDYLLAQRGWTILRFDDKAIEDMPQQISGTVTSYIQELSKPKKAASVKDSMMGDIRLFTGSKGSLLDVGKDYTKYCTNTKYTTETFGSRDSFYPFKTAAVNLGETKWATSG